MKFKMSDKSLFAMLLRSPWWVSFLVMLAVALAAGALLPDAYKKAGMLGGFPFFVIGVMAAWRQRNAISADRVQALTEQARSMAWPEFSKRLAQAFRQQGFEVSSLPNGPADFQLEKNGRLTLVSAKRWKAANVGAEWVSELLSARDKHEAAACSLVSLGRISPAAMALVQAQGVEVVDAQGIAQCLNISAPKS